MTRVAVQDFDRQVDLLIRARYSAIYVVTFEEDRLADMLYAIAKKQGKKLYVWSSHSGLLRYQKDKRQSESEPQHCSPKEVLKEIHRRHDSALFLLRDFNPYFEDPTIARQFRDLASELKSTYKTLIISAATMDFPVALEKDLTVLDLPLPTAAELRELLRSICVELDRSSQDSVRINKNDMEALVRAAQGLTLSEAENAFAKAAVHEGVLTSKDVDIVQNEKQQIIRKSGMLEFHPPDTTLADVGGLDSLKRWLARRGKAWHPDAHQFGLPEPKGMLLLGVPGCGKSLTARAVAQYWGVPLLHLDLGRVFTSMLGSSEENMRRALAIAEGIAPAVLWIDEIEKGIGGSGKGEHDGGTSSRVFGTLLTWMQERKAPVFVCATANRIDDLPPELLRRGRFDEIFFVDLPDSRSREEILSIHLSKRKRNPKNFNLTDLAELSQNFSGAELEHCVVESLFAAFEEERDLEDTDLAQAMAEVTPLAVTSAEDITRLRNWAQKRTRSADYPGPLGKKENPRG